MLATREQVLGELQSGGMSEGDLERMGAEYWVDYIVEYRNTGCCGSVNWSTAQFLPIVSRLLAALKSPPVRT